VYIAVPDNSSALATKLPAENTTIYLLTDTDSDFSDATETELTLNGTNWELPAGIDLADASYGNTIVDTADIIFQNGAPKPTVDPVASIVTATSPIEADGTATSTITIQLYDTDGNAMTTSGGTVTLTTTGSAVLSNVVDNGECDS